MKPLRQTLTPVGLSASLVLAAACSPGPAPTQAPAPPVEQPAPEEDAAPTALADTSPDPTPPPADPAPPPIDEVALRRAFNTLAVHHQRPARGVLYTWTTAEQIEQLRASQALLIKSSSDAGLLSRYQRTVAALATDKKDAAARLLDDPAFARQRYTWTNPWALALGYGDERYGDRLLRIELRPDAVLAVLLPTDSGTAITFQTLDGTPVDTATAAAQAHRLAGAYFVGAEAPCDTLGQPTGCGLAYRELVLFNEAAIASWEVGTTTVQADLDASIQVLSRVRAVLERQPTLDRPLDAWVASVQTRSWPAPLPEPQISELYEAALAGLDPRYAPTPANLTTLIDALQTLQGQQGDAMRGILPRTFGGLQRRPTPHKLPPPPMKRPRGTMY